MSWPVGTRVKVIYLTFSSKSSPGAYEHAKQNSLNQTGVIVYPAHQHPEFPGRVVYGVDLDNGSQPIGGYEFWGFAQHELIRLDDPDASKVQEEEEALAQ